MKRLLLLLLLAIWSLVALAPGTGSAQVDEQGRGRVYNILFRRGEYLVVERGAHAKAAIALHTDATIGGTVEDYLLVVGGDAEINGRVNGDVVVINGNLVMDHMGVVAGDVWLTNGGISGSPYGRVTGQVHNGWDFGWSRWAFPALPLVGPWITVTMAALWAGLSLAGLCGRQLSAAAGLLSARAGWGLLAAVFTHLALLVFAALAAVTTMRVASTVDLMRVASTVDLMYLLLPVLWFFGYLVIGTAFGAFALRRRSAATGRPYLPVVVGILAFQLVALIPIFGTLFAVLAGLVGFGGLVLLPLRGVAGGGTGRARRVSVPATS
jgi:hypothetical protein